jgi:hypothetical protein
VKLLKSIFTLLLLAAWLPATAHCGLEGVGLVALDECCEAAPNGNSHSDDACKIVEDSGFKTECAATVPAPPEVLFVLLDLSILPCSVLTESLELIHSEFSAHHLPQFVIHTALPIRGPSFAS